jgi:hypothetical protein
MSPVEIFGVATASPVSLALAQTMLAWSRKADMALGVPLGLDVGALADCRGVVAPLLGLPHAASTTVADAVVQDQRRIAPRLLEPGISP